MYICFYLIIFVNLISISMSPAMGARETIYLTNYRQDTVSVIDMPTNTNIATITVGDDPVGMEIGRASCRERV